MGFRQWMMLTGSVRPQDVDELRAEIEELRRRSKQDLHGEVNDAMIHSLVSENRELALYVSTIFRVLVFRNIISRAELAKLIDAVDEEDGRKDGRYDGNIKDSVP